MQFAQLSRGRSGAGSDSNGRGSVVVACFGGLRNHDHEGVVAIVGSSADPGATSSALAAGNDLDEIWEYIAADNIDAADQFSKGS